MQTGRGDGAATGRQDSGAIPRLPLVFFSGRHAPITR